MTAPTWFAYAADALALAGLLVITLGVIGVFRMPDVYAQLHAASKVVFLGLIALLVALAADGDPETVAKAALTGAFLLVATPVSSHAIARAAFVRGERMRTRGAVDESGRGLLEGELPSHEEEDADA